MGTLRASLKLDDLARARQHLDSCTDTIVEADAGEADDRNRDAIRADVLVDLITGHLEAVGAHTYKPGAALHRHVQAHDRTCQFPGCRRRAVSCETDHAVAFDHDDPLSGGLTEAGNLHCLCKRHHRLKHEAGWTIVREDGTTTWRSPTGRQYVNHIEPYLEPDPPPF